MTSFCPRKRNPVGRSSLTAHACCVESAGRSARYRARRAGGGREAISCPRGKISCPHMAIMFLVHLSPLLTAIAHTPPASITRHRVQWKATDGFPEEAFASFEAKNYQGMINDQSRTPVYAEALRRALAARAGELVVLDIGTGPVALLALMAAREGARKVYAIEASEKVAAMAREAVLASGYQHVVEVITGLSTEVDLPEKADILVAEVPFHRLKHPPSPEIPPWLMNPRYSFHFSHTQAPLADLWSIPNSYPSQIVGSVASDEGIYLTMFDAARRHVKRPDDPTSYIPRSVETWCAPVSYALHHPTLGPAGFDWEAVRRDGPPPRFACSYPAVCALAQPQLLEQIRFGVDELPAPGARLSRRIDFEVCPSRMKEVENACVGELQRAGCPADARTLISQEVASGVSGIAMWPRLVLGDDNDASLHIESRGRDGRPRKSHWQVAMPLLCASPQRVTAGERIHVLATTELGERVDIPLEYALDVEFGGAP